jgi:hypothetical protein
MMIALATIDSRSRRILDSRNRNSNLQTRLTPSERRERTRLRSERYRRAHGIMPRKPAQKPWLAEGISRSTWYRRRAKAREQAALAAATAARLATLDRLDHQLSVLNAELERCAAIQAGGMKGLNWRAQTLNIALSIADLDGLIARKVSLDIVEGPILPMAASEIVRRKRRSGQRAGR